MSVKSKIIMTTKQKVYLVSSMILLLGMVIFVVINAPLQSFWSDEMSTIGYIRSGMSFLDIIK